jgi:hypothetical protein
MSFLTCLSVVSLLLVTLSLSVKPGGFGKVCLRYFGLEIHSWHCRTVVAESRLLVVTGYDSRREHEG